MLSIVLNPALCDPSTGRKPWKGMDARRQAKTFYTVESTEAEIGTLAFIPGLLTPQHLPGQNSFRTINIGFNQPLQIDDDFWRPQMAISGNVNIVAKIADAISAGILLVTRSSSTTPTVPMTAKEFYNWMLNWTDGP